MSKEMIIKEKMSLMEWSNTLKNIPESLWFKPFREGAWGTADVISHFIFWDQFVIKNRIHFLLNNEDFPKILIDADEINKQASNYARSGILQEELINEFICTRKELVTLLKKIPSVKFDQKYPRKEDMTLNDYFLGIIEHDLKHKEQIELHIKNK
ncbi:DinB family protein [Neobacillus drentensis]|uniref:DinB family protein n=1 Tax=Neobacillus drentensis TaxID=220684 RepID=UPI002FFDBBB8